MYDLLNEPLIGVRTPQGPKRACLPELLALLSAGAIEGYTGLRAHQSDPWHVFLVQLAAATLARSPQENPPPDLDFWRAGLLHLAEGQASAWHLVEADVGKPAFLQHPWQAGDAAGYKLKAATPDELDVLVTAKNHDVKARRIREDEIEAWLFALMTYQTTSGYLGAGNFGSVRMNGGFASRPIIAWVSDLHPSRRFLEELAIVRAEREQLFKEAYGYRADGIVLTWLRPWDRQQHQYILKDLDPCFIESCRPVRLQTAGNGALCALGATSKARQIGPKGLENGDVGDPWIPLDARNKKGHAALTVSASGFNPELVTNLLFEEGYRLTPLQRPRPGEQPGWFVASALVRGQGKTEGFHRLELPIPAKARMALIRPKEDDARKRAAECARQLLAQAKDAAIALRTALTVLVEGGPDQADFDREAVKRWIKEAMERYRQEWEQGYYPTLWRAFEEDCETVNADWRRRLVETTQDLLAEAAERLPLPGNRQYRALTRSQGALIGVLRTKHLVEETA